MPLTLTDLIALRIDSDRKDHLQGRYTVTAEELAQVSATDWEAFARWAESVDLAVEPIYQSIDGSLTLNWKSK